MDHHPFIDLDYAHIDGDTALAQARRYYARMDTRRSVRHFSDESVPREIIEELIMAASTAPSGAHRQPWTYVAVANSAVKKEIRLAAEAEEKKSYEERMPDEWKDALEPLGTNWEKPFLEIAPWLVVLFQQKSGFKADGTPRKHYYVSESVGISAGMFISAVHHAGLVTLTHTPSPMGFLGDILGRPDNEKAYLLLPVGYPADDCKIPDLKRKPLDEVGIFVE